MTDLSDKKIVLFDGVCNFCNYWVRFALKRDKNKKLLFTSIQSENAKSILFKYNINPTAITSVIFIENNKAYTQSSAVFRICKNLSGIWKVFYVFIVIPKPIRDFVYNRIAENRYKWFGKRDECMVPEPWMLERFLP